MKNTKAQKLPVEVSAAKMKQIAKKLGIRLPSDWESSKSGNAKGKKSLKALFSKLKAGGGPIGGDHSGPLHGNTHVNVVDPNVTNNSVHLAVHTDTHGNSEPY
jgi:hypothetical protein